MLLALSFMLASLSGPFHGDRELLTTVLDGLFHIAVADGILAPSEEIFLAQVAKEFGFSDEEFRMIKLRNYKCGNHCPFALLEIPPDATDATESAISKTCGRKPPR